MKDITAKIETRRRALAESTIAGDSELLARIEDGDSVEKGDPLSVARVAAIQGAKSTPDVLPFCHPIPITNTTVEFRFDTGSITTCIEATTLASTGVEMEALTAASIGSLALYDMLKPHTDELWIEGTHLIEKEGGKSDFRPQFDEPLRAAVIVLSDSVAAGKKEDSAGKAVADGFEKLPQTQMSHYDILPDEPTEIRQLVEQRIEDDTDLVVTVGGTGLSPRDRTVEAIEPLLERQIPGIMEAVRAYGQQRTPYAMLSRGIAGESNQSLVLTFPGSTSGATESFNAVFPQILHIFNVLRMEPHTHD